MTGSKVIQVTNIAPQATKDQMQTLFGYLGKIEDIRLYPTIRDVAVPVQSRICYVKFHDPVCVGVAQHLTNTVFIDRALIVVPFQSSEFHQGEIPDEQKALELTSQGTSIPGLFPSESKLPPNVSNQIEGTPPNQVIQTYDPRLENNGLPPYPPLPANLDSRKVEEIRRTLVIGQLDSSTSAQHVLDFAAKAGEVKYIRFCLRTDDKKHYALVEFTDQVSVIAGLKLNDTELHGKKVKVFHSIQAIVKPQTKSNEAAQREIEEAMSRVKEAQNLISAAIDPVIGLLGKEKRSRSRSRSRRSRSRSRGRRSSHSRSRRSRSRSRRRSRSRGRVRSHSRSRRSRSRSKRTRSRSRDRKRKSRSPGRKKSRSKSRSRSRRRSISRSRRSRSKSKLKSSRGKGNSKSKEKKEDDSKRDLSKKVRDDKDILKEELLETKLETSDGMRKEEEDKEAACEPQKSYVECDLEIEGNSIKNEECEMDLERKSIKKVDKDSPKELKDKLDRDDKYRDGKMKDKRDSERERSRKERNRGKFKEKSGSNGGGKMSTWDKAKSPRHRSRSRSRRRHSPTPTHRHRKSRSRSLRRRSRSPLPPPRRKSRSPRRHSRSRSRHKSLSRSIRRSPSRHGSHSRHLDSRAASTRRSVSRRKSKSPGRGGHSRRSRSHKRSRSRSKTRKDKDRRKDKGRDMDKREKDREKEKSADRKRRERRDDREDEKRKDAKVPRNYDEEEKGFDTTDQDDLHSDQRTQDDDSGSAMGNERDQMDEHVAQEMIEKHGIKRNEEEDDEDDDEDDEEEEEDEDDDSEGGFDTKVQDETDEERSPVFIRSEEHKRKEDNFEDTNDEVLKSDSDDANEDQIQRIDSERQRKQVDEDHSEDDVDDDESDDDEESEDELNSRSSRNHVTNINPSKLKHKMEEMDISTSP